MKMQVKKEKLRIAYVMTPITFGGAEKVSLNFLKNVDRQQFHVDPLLFLRPWEKETIFETELRHLGIGYSPLPVAKSQRIDMFRFFTCFSALKNRICQADYDLIHTHGYLADILGLCVARRTALPITSTCHGFINTTGKLFLYNHLDHLALRRFGSIIAVSESIKEELAKSGIGQENITVIENCPETFDAGRDVRSPRALKDVGANCGEVVVGYLGRLSSEKGIGFLVEAIALLSKRNVPVKLLIIGEGPQRRELEELSGRHGLGNVVFAGFQANTAEWWPMLDILVLPSLTEGTPMVLLEAMSRGVPCIASAVGGIPRLIDSGVDGILVEPGRPDQLSDALQALCMDRPRRMVLADNAARKIRQKFDIRQWAAKIGAHYLRTATLNHR